MTGRNPDGAARWEARRQTSRLYKGWDGTAERSRTGGAAS